jgi:shikimate kinase
MLSLSLKMEEKLTELMRKREELYDTSNKKYCDSVAKEKVWVQKAEE